MNEDFDQLGARPAPGAEGDVEVYDVDESGRLSPVIEGGSVAGRRGRSLGLSVPGAAAATFLVVALAFGAGGFVPREDAGGREAAAPAAPDAGDPAASSADGTYARGGDGVAPDGDDKPGADAPKDEPGAEEGSKPGADAPKDEPGETGEVEATDKPDEASKPAPEMRVVTRLYDGAVVVDWTACAPDGFWAYKVVRSTDEYVAWPLDANDTLAGVVEDPAKTLFKDTGASAGRKWFYRVFALVLREGGTVVGCRTNVSGILLPKEEPTPKPEPGPGDGTLGLVVSIKEGHPLVDWTACGSDLFSHYKIVRSTDATVRFPDLGGNDKVVGVVEDRSVTKMWDKGAPGNAELWYRVFCVRKGEAGYVVLAASAAKRVETPKQEPAPEPTKLGFEVGLTDGGKVILSWEACGADGFVYYKVVRSASANPSYFPMTEGTQLLAAIGNPGETTFLDGDVASGQHWFYRVQSIGTWNGEKVLLGQTTVHDVTIP